MRDISFASQHWDPDSHEVSLRAVNARDPPNPPKSGRLDCLATRGLCSQAGGFEQEGFFGVTRNVSGFRKDVRKSLFSVFMWIHKAHQSRAVLQEHKIQVQ